MTFLGKRTIAAVLAGTLMLPAVTAAEAGPRNGWRDHGRGWHDAPRHHHHHHKPHRKHGKKNDNVGAAIAAGVIGLAAGAILLGATSRPSYAGPPPANNYRPAPYPGRVSGAVGYQPWSPAWYRYCASKYRSFVPETGTYTTYRGEQKFCQ